MRTSEEIEQVEQAITTITTFFQEHYNQMSPKVFSKWGDVRSNIVEELYYMKKSLENEEKQT